MSTVARGPACLLVLERRHQDAEAAALLEFGEVHIFLDGVDLGLAGADGDRRDAVLVEPVGVETAVGEQIGRLDARASRAPWSARCTTGVSLSSSNGG